MEDVTMSMAEIRNIIDQVKEGKYGNMGARVVIDEATDKLGFERNFNGQGTVKGYKVTETFAGSPSDEFPVPYSVLLQFKGVTVYHEIFE